MLQAIKTVSVTIWLLVLWDPTPAYVPRRSRTKWAFSTMTHYLKSWLGPLGDEVEEKTETLHGAVKGTYLGPYRDIREAFQQRQMVLSLGL